MKPLPNPIARPIWYKYASKNNLLVRVVKKLTCDRGKHPTFYKDEQGFPDICKVCGY